MKLKDFLDDFQDKVFRDRKGDYTILVIKEISRVKYIQGAYLNTPISREKFAPLESAVNDDFVENYHQQR